MGEAGMEGVWAEALELLPLQERVELPELQVVLEGDCGRFKDYAECVPLSMLVTAEISVSKEDRLKALRSKKFYLPQRGNRGALLLLLLLFADAYPRPISIADLKSTLAGYGVDPESVRKLLYRYYHYYGVLERVGYGLYRMRSEYYEVLRVVMPDWRVRLLCLSKLLPHHDASVCEDMISRVKTAIVYLVNMKRIRESRKVAESRGESRKLTRGVNIGDYANKLKAEAEHKRCSLHVNKILNVLRERKPALYDQLGSDADRRMAAELIAVLYKRAKEGRPYIAGTSGDAIHMAIADEAYALWGSGSSLWQTLDWDGIREIVALLRASGIVFTARYGVEYKLRLDKSFEKVLNGVVRCG